MTGLPLNLITSLLPTSPVTVTATTSGRSAPGEIVWQGVTDKAGQFRANTPSGQFHVLAIKEAGGSGQIVLPAFQDGFVDVSVNLGTRIQAVVMVGSGAAEAELVAFVEEVTVSAANDPTLLLIEANGSVPTSDWVLPNLVSSQITADGWLLLDFLARPLNAVTPVTTSIRARTTIPKLPGLKGVRVRAQKGSREAAVP